MDSPDEFPPVPPPPDDGALPLGETWGRLWLRAHREMAPWGRRPAPYLLDSIVTRHRSSRWWLRHRFGDIAQVTRSRPPDDEDSFGTLRWNMTTTDPDGRWQLIRILLNPDTNEIFNAFPE